jgi:hypothetical protein
VVGFGRWVRLVNGDQVRSTWFLRQAFGYDGAEVDDLLGRVAAELDAGRSARPLIEDATLRRPMTAWSRGGHCDVDAVDWFLDQLLLHPGRWERAEVAGDHWRGLDSVTQYTCTRNGVSDSAQHAAEKSWRAQRRSFAKECQDAWRDFGQQPGTHLWWGDLELRTAAQQTLASLRGLARPDRPITASASGRSFTLRRTDAATSVFPGSAELAADSARDYDGHYAKTRRSQLRELVGEKVRELVDEAGIPILCISGLNLGWRAFARITFPDQRWLRFLVRGTRKANAIMTAVDQSGNMVVRYRLTDKGLKLRLKSYFGAAGPIEIAVRPDWELTEERMLAIAISAPWLDSYFPAPEAGGGG